MKIRTKKLAPLALTVALALSGAACENTEEGLEQDTQDAEQELDEGAEDTEEELDEETTEE